MTSAPRIAVIPGDGIGVEVMQAARAVLDRMQARFGLTLDLQVIEAGADYYRAHGSDVPEGFYEALEAFDCVLMGAIGHPDVRFADGTEIAPHLTIRARFDLVAGERPVRKYPNTPRILSNPDAETIDFVVLRESTEGLFASRGKGILEDDRVARDTMVISRSVTEQLCDHAFALARKRKAQGRGHGRVTCVDKSNVFVSMAFFRKIFDERAKLHPDIEAERRYVDATALDLVKKPWIFDVLVMENMFADILSDLGGGLVGGMGMAPCAEIGRNFALFQPAHGTAPDIAGQGKANPTAMIVSTAMMLDWLGERHGNNSLKEAGRALDQAVYDAYAQGGILPIELGGTSGLTEVTDAVLAQL